MSSLMEILDNATTVQVVLKNIEPEDISLPSVSISERELTYLIQNRSSLGSAQIDPIVKQVLTIYHGTQDTIVKGKLLCILMKLAV